LSLFLSGCAAFRKKFVRKRKRKKEVKVVIETKEYECLYSIEEKYKRYFLFWRTAQAELIRELDARKVNRKRRMVFAQRTLDDLRQMRRLLLPEKHQQLDVYITEQEGVKKELDKHKLGRSQRMRIKATLQRRKREIQKEFSFKQMREYLIKQ
jgi:hypothetical protein